MPAALLVISDPEPLAWLVREQCFAIPAGRMSTAPRAGTQLLLYTTRGCYRNPTRDRGLVMRIGTVTSDAELLDEPVTFRNRDFLAGFGVEIEGVTPPHHGVDLGRYAGRMDAIPDAASWSVRLRRSLVPLSASDARTLVAALKPMLRPLDEQLAAYDEACRVSPAVRGRSRVQSERLT